MLGRTLWVFLLAVGMGGLCGIADAETGRTIRIQVRDGRTGQKISPSNIQVKFDRKQTANPEWVKQNEDGSTEIKVPEGSVSLSVHATYDNSMEYYINCDATRQKDTSTESWYPVGEILSAGLSMPNECVRPKSAEKLKDETKPGEFVLWVRKRNWREQAQE